MTTATLTTPTSIYLHMLCPPPCLIVTLSSSFSYFTRVIVVVVKFSHAVLVTLLALYWISKTGFHLTCKLILIKVSAKQINVNVETYIF